MSRLVANFDADDLRDLAALDGLLVGSLCKSDLRLFEDAVERDLAYHSFEGGIGWLMGLSKVRLGQQQ